MALFISRITVRGTAFVLISQRGYKGSLRYGARRVLVQVVQELLVIALIVPCKWLSLPIPDAALIIISLCLALCVGLPINYKSQFLPVNCTLANATFIIAYATVRDTAMFPMRVMECVAGFVIGYLVNYIIFRQKDRAADIRRNIARCADSLLCDGDFAEYARTVNEAAVMAEERKRDGRHRQNREKGNRAEHSAADTGDRAELRAVRHRVCRLPRVAKRLAALDTGQRYESW